MRSKILAGAAVPLFIASVWLAPLPAAAQQQGQQEGLVNVAVGDVTVQVPVAVAAAVCGVEVNALAQEIQSGDASCDATSAEAAAENKQFVRFAEQQGVALPAG